MAAESFNRSGCVANGAQVTDRLRGFRVDGGSYRCRRPRRRAGRLVRDGQVGRGVTGPALGPRSQSLSAIVGRRAGSGSGGRRVRSSPRCPVTDLHLHAAPVVSAPTTVGAYGMGRAASVRLRSRESGAVDPARQSRLRGIHPSNTRADDSADAAQTLLNAWETVACEFGCEPIRFCNTRCAGWSEQSSRSPAARTDPDAFASQFATARPGSMGPTAPACGLSLTAVEYKPPLFNTHNRP